MTATSTKLVDINPKQDAFSEHSFSENDSIQNEFRFKTVKFIKIILGASLIVALIIAFPMLFRANNSVTKLSSIQDKRNETILRELTGIDEKLQALAQHPKNNKEQGRALDTIEKSIVTIQQSISEAARSADIDKISTQLVSVKDHVDAQMSDIKKAISESNGNKQYLEAEALPFRVLSIDVIGGQPYVSVNYSDHITPLGVSDLLAGWRLLVADYDSGLAEFINEKNQYVKVSLQGS